MQLAEQHRVDRGDPRGHAMDAATFASKNLDNAAMYVKRQAYIREGNRIISSSELDQLRQPTEQYRNVPAKGAQWVLKQVGFAWESYFAAVAEGQVNPATFLGHPRLPQYLDKHGRNRLVYTAQAISRDPKNAGWIVPSGVAIRIATRIAIRVATKRTHAQVRLVRKATPFVDDVVYTRAPEDQPVYPELIASLDLGVNNVATIASNQPDLVPLLVNDRPLKRLKQLYNRRRAKMPSRLPEEQYQSRAVDEMADMGQRALSSYRHTASRSIIDLLVRKGSGTLVIGKNVDWKHDVNLGRKNHRSFVFIPHARFMPMRRYKAELVGMQVVLVEENDTSTCSFLDGGEIRHHASYRGKRVKRGWLVSSTGRGINSDVNGSYHILPRAFPAAFAQGIDQVKMHPQVRFVARSSSGSEQAVPTASGNGLVAVVVSLPLR